MTKGGRNPQGVTDPADMSKVVLTQYSPRRYMPSGSVYLDLTFNICGRNARYARELFPGDWPLLHEHVQGIAGLDGGEGPWNF